MPDTAIPPAERTTLLRRYLAFLTLGNQVAKATLVSQAVAFVWKAKFGFDPASDVAFAAFMGGLRHLGPLLSEKRPQRDAFPVSALQRFVDSPPAGMSEDDHLVASAALVYALRGIQRGGQVADLECRDVTTFDINGSLALRVTIRSSKTDPKGARPHSVVIDQGVTPLDPLRILDRYTTRRFGVPLRHWAASGMAASSRPFFCRGARPIATSSLRDWVRRVAEHAGLDGYYGSHSLRVSGACWAILGGMSFDMVMAIGGWKSQSSAAIYLRSLVAAVAGGSKIMGL